jgi:Protein of unknown function (DUF2283)
VLHGAGRPPNRQDKARQTALVRLDESKIVESEELSPGVVLDYNAENQGVGVGTPHLSRRAARPELGKLVCMPAVAENPASTQQE